MDQQEYQTTVLTQLQAIWQAINDLRSEFKAEIQDVRAEIRDVKADMRVISKDIREIHDARHAVKIKFGWGWSAASLLIAIVASGITQVFGG